MHVIANEPHARDRAEYTDKLRETWRNHRLRSSEPALSVEVTVPDASGCETEPHVRGEERYGHRILTIESSAVPNTLAALLLHLRDRTGSVPHIYFPWTEGNPGRGDAAVSGPRRRRRAAADPRGAAPGRARSGTPPARARRLSRRWGS
ncbi:hypothetical protein GCM10023334_067090 [Nonomuraea thailandensis]